MVENLNPPVQGAKFLRGDSRPRAVEASKARRFFRVLFTVSEIALVRSCKEPAAHSAA